MLQSIITAVAHSGVAFLDLTANQQVFAQALSTGLAPQFAAMGLQLDGLTVQSISLPEDLQKILDQKIGMGMGQFMQYQTAQAILNLGLARTVGLVRRAMRWAWVQAWRWGRCWHRICKWG